MGLGACPVRLCGEEWECSESTAGFNGVRKGLGVLCSTLLFFGCFWPERCCGFYRPWLMEGPVRLAGFSFED